MNIQTIMDIIKPIAKAVAVPVVGVIMLLVGWLIEKTGVPIDVDPQELNTWVTMVLLWIAQGAAVWFTKNSEGG